MTCGHGRMQHIPHWQLWCAACFQTYDFTGVQSSHKAMNPQNYGTICQDMPRHHTRLALSENRVCLKIQWFISNPIIICHMSIATHGDVKPISRQTYVGAILKWEPQIDRSYCFLCKGKPMVLEPQFEVPTICGSIFSGKSNISRWRIIFNHHFHH